MQGEVYAIAYCETADQCYRLQLDNNERIILDFAISRRKPVHMQNVSRGLRLETAAELRACPVCGSRVAAGCRCMTKALPCEKNIGFRFPCVYCSRLKIIGFERT